MTQLTEHFTLEELSHSDTAEQRGIVNWPMPDLMPNLLAVAAGLEKVRAMLGNIPINIDSGYRCPELNSAVHGVVHSAHETGWAADFVCPAFGEPIDIVKLLAASDLKFDQLIQEGTWVHVSFDPQMRQQVLTAHFDGVNPATYTKGA